MKSQGVDSSGKVLYLRFDPFRHLGVLCMMYSGSNDNKFLLTFMKISISGSGLILASFSLLANSASISLVPQRHKKRKEKRNQTKMKDIYI
jgi:hypothetical protein